MKSLLQENNFLKLLFSFCVFSFAFALTNETKLVVEPNHSTIEFSVPISSGLTRITGKFTDFNIEIRYIEKDMTKSLVSARIKTASVNTGIPARDEDLKTKDFFETEKFPEITFDSDSIVKVDEGFIAYGKFQMHGITKVIALPFKITGQHSDDVVGFTSRYTLKRSDFGVGTAFKHTTDDNFIANEIGVEIDFWTKKFKEK